MHRRPKQQLVALIALAVAFLALPGSAVADEGTPDPHALDPSVLGNATLTVDRKSLAEFRVTASCQPHDGSNVPTPTCVGDLQVYFAGDYGSGRDVTIGTVPVELPLGQTATFTVRSTKVLDHLAAANLKQKIEAAKVYASFAWNDPRHAERQSDVLTPKGVLVQRSFVNAYTCGLPRTVTFSARTKPTQFVTTVIGSDGREVTDAFAVTGTKLDTLYAYRANSPTTIRLNGLTYVFASGTEFHLKCMGIGTGARVRRFPVGYVERGSLRVSGRPTGRIQINSGASTPVGLFSADSRAAVDFTVVAVRPKRSSNNLRATHATLRSRRGTLTARQVFKIAPSAHCRPGRGLRMYLDGHTVSL